MKIVVTGKQGQIARSLLERAPSAGHEVAVLGRPELDLAHVDKLGERLAALRPDAIVSAAAYTAVDKAEGEPDTAFAINEKGPEKIARAAAWLGVPLIHMSTDYVFDGAGDRPYTETDVVAPLGVYGRSKLAGEEAVAAAYAENSAILRTAWVYSPFAANFAKTMLRLATERDELAVVADQRGNPTSALDIADGIFTVAEQLAQDSNPALRGLFHMTAAGDTSWAGFAEVIFAISARVGGPVARVRHIATADYPTPARRPANSRLDCTKLARVHGVRLADWRVSADPIVSRLATEITMAKGLS